MERIGIAYLDLMTRNRGSIRIRSVLKSLFRFDEIVVESAGYRSAGGEKERYIC